MSPLYKGHRHGIFPRGDIRWSEASWALGERYDGRDGDLEGAGHGGGRRLRGGEG